MELSPRGAAKLGPGCAPTAPPPAAQWGRQGGRGLSRDPQSIHREGAQKPPAQTWSGAGKKDLGATAGRAVDGGRGLPLPPSTGDAPGAGPRGQDPRAGLYAATAAAARPEAPSTKHPGAAGTGQGAAGLPVPVRSPGQLREHRRGAGAGRGAPGASPPLRPRRSHPPPSRPAPGSPAGHGELHLGAGHAAGRRFQRSRRRHPRAGAAAAPRRLLPRRRGGRARGRARARRPRPRRQRRPGERGARPRAPARRGTGGGGRTPGGRRGSAPPGAPRRGSRPGGCSVPAPVPSGLHVWRRGLGAISVPPLAERGPGYL